MTSSASERVSGGRIDASRRPSIVFPVPGGPASRRLWLPAAASSSARRPRSCPRTSARSGSSGGGRGSSLRGRRLDRVLASEVSDGLGDVPDANRLDARQRRLPRRLRRAEEARKAGTSGAFGGRDRPRDGPDAAVEPELADTRVLREPVGRHLPRRREHGEGDRDVEARPLLAERRRGEVDRDDLAGPLEERRSGPRCGRGASPPGTRGRRAPRWRTTAADPCAGALRHRRAAARGRRART